MGGRAIYAKHLPKEDVEQASGPRGREPAPCRDPMRASQGVRSALSGETMNDDVEAERTMRKALGCKRIVAPRSDVADPILWGEDMPERTGKRTFADRENIAEHCGVLRAGAREANAAEQNRVPRKPGHFKDGYSAFTVTQSKKHNDIYRFERGESDNPPVGLKRAISAPPSQFMLAHPDLPRQPSTPARDALTTRQSSASAMERTLKFDTPEEVATAREQRQRQDSKFSYKCKEISSIYVETRSAAKDTVQRVHHMGSAAVAAQLRWD